MRLQIHQPKRNEITSRGVSRMFDYSYLTSTCIPIRNGIFAGITSLHLSRNENIQLDSWEKIEAFLSNCNQNLRYLELKEFDFKSNQSERENRIVESHDEKMLPSLERLSLISCDQEACKRLLNGIDSRRLRQLEIDFSLISSSNCDSDMFYKHQLLPILNAKFQRINTIKLSSLPFAIEGLVHADDLLARLRSLSLIDLHFDDDASGNRLIHTLESKCKKLGTIQLRLPQVRSSSIVSLCISQKQTLSTLHLLTAKHPSWLYSDSAFTDVHAIQIINNCKHLADIHLSGHENTEQYKDKSRKFDFEEPSEEYLTAVWVSHAAKTLGPQLMNLGMSYLTLQKTILSQIACKCINLRSINLRYTKLHTVYANEFRFFLEERGPLLVSFDLHGCKTIKSSHLKSMMCNLSKGRLRVLKVSMLSDWFSTKNFKKLLKKTCKSLETLEIFGSSVIADAPMPFLDIILNQGKKKYLRNVVASIGHGEQQSDEYQSKIKELREKFEEVELHFRSVELTDDYEFFP